ncbi:MAG: bifunctional DNA-formamidopyrimidine glycosylase/DNA-(apurinic or apyrimidinic site) lyase [Actinomycetota bacterium]|nr:bifunctional DNA-formamidopyrimidine glycosylase/DNA-(apurinic or apyrimidinic site) lyase [Actinomycetota bacterium]
MPELPEVESIRQQLEPLLLDAQIVGATAHPSPKFVSASAAVGHAITHIGRRGKYLLFRLNAPHRKKRELIIHLGMTGALWVGDDPPRDPHARAHWQLSDGRHFWFRDIRRFGRLAVVKPGEYQTLPTLQALGPEPFDPNLDPQRFYQSLAMTHRSIKTALLSQRPVAGLGNIYADEALWRSRISPVARQVGRDRAGRLLEAIRNVLTEALQHGGTTLKDYRTPDGNQGLNQYRLDCYGRTGHPCRRCSGTLSRRIVGQRSTTWCPTCQAR